MIIVLLVLVAITSTGAWWHLARQPKRSIQVSPLLMEPSTNKYDVMNRMRAVAEQHRTKDVVRFPEDDDAQSP